MVINKYQDTFKPVSSVYGKIERILLAAWQIDSDWKSGYDGVLSTFEQREVILFGIFDPEWVIEVFGQSGVAILAEVSEEEDTSIKAIKSLFEELFLDGNSENELLLKKILKREVNVMPFHYIKVNETKADFSQPLIRKSFILNNFNLEKFLSDIKIPQDVLARLRVPGIGTWIQDPFVILQNNHGLSAFLEPFYFSRGFGYQFIAEQVGEELDMPIFPFKLVLDGGNMLFGNDYALIGKNLLYEAFLLNVDAQSLEEVNQAIMEFCQNIDLQQTESFERIIQYYHEKLGLDQVGKIIWVGSNQNACRTDRLLPLVHVDMFLSLVGKCKASGKEMVLLAKIYNRSMIGGGFSKMDCNELCEINDELEAVSRQLDNEGFKVVRIPLVVEKSDDGRRMVYRSYNNCLVEIYEEKDDLEGTVKEIKQIYLPQYGNDQHKLAYEELCQEVITTLSKIDFQTTIIPGPFDDWARANGSLHCKTKVLKRSTN